MFDFTLRSYHQLLKELKKQGYMFITYRDYISNPIKGKNVILRHDIDQKPHNALKIARIEKTYEIQGSYYFRVKNGMVQEVIIQSIAELGHEIGYHYENLSTVSKKKHAKKIINKDHIFALAIENFKKNLTSLRRFYPVKTICMHGSPWSKLDNRDLWNHYNYQDYGIIGEPYFDLDSSQVLYLTDTGRRWDGTKVNIRDKMMNLGTEESEGFLKKRARMKNPILKIQHSFKTTFDIINTLKTQGLPHQIMINTHPQRWNNLFFPWFWEFIWQKTKNIIKRTINKDKK